MSPFTEDDLALDRTRAVLLIIDVQERLVPAMPPAVIEALVRNTTILIAAARQLWIPIVISEQYPKGLGKTIAPIAAALAETEAAGGAVHRLEKTEFSACGAIAFAALAPVLSGHSQWIVTGMETHVCVWQTVRDLRGGGAAVHLAADAVSSRTKANWRVGLDLARAAGGLVTSTEAVVFDLLHRAGTDEFKALAKLIK